MLRGDTGATVWSLGTDPAYRTDPSAHPAIGDLDLDGVPEIVVPGEGQQLLAVRGDGTPMWVSDNCNFNGVKSGSPAIANLDGGGAPEVIYGRSVFDNGGVAIWQAASGATGSTGRFGPLSCIADLDDDMRPELIAGGTAYSFAGTVGVDFVGVPLWTWAPWQRIATSSSATTASARGRSSGSPTRRTARRNAPVPSVFDFDRDGRSEVIYADEWYLRIYPGVEPDCPAGPNYDGTMTDEDALFIDINSSRTRTENPVIADVDGDFKAEIIVSSNNESAQGDIGDAGIEVFEDRLDNWVATLPIWNQHTYHVANVAADGTIPPIEAPN